MSTLTTLNVRIGADISGFEQQMGKLQRSLSSVGNNLRNVGKSMSVALTLPIAGAGAAAIKAASDVEEMEAKFNTVFRNVGGRVTRELGKFASSVGRSRFELMGMSATLGDILKPMGFTEENAADLSVGLTQLAVDLSSFNNMPMDEALQRLRGTLVGAHENALAFGVVINENTLKQELARMGADKLTGAQKEQAKVQARINLLMKGTTDAQGDALRTSGSFANQLRALQNAVRDVGVEIGKILLPVATDLVQKFRQAVDFVGTLSPEMHRMGVVIAGVAAAAGPLVFALGGVASTLSGIARALMLGMGIFNPYVASITAIAALGTLVFNNWGTVSGVFSDITKKIKDDFGPVIDDLKAKVREWVDDAIDLGAAIYGTVLTWWDENGAGLVASVSEALVSIGAAAAAGLSALIQIVDLGLNNAKAFWATWGGDIVNIVGFAFQSVLNTISTQMSSLAALIRAGVDLSRGNFEGAWNEFITAMDAQWEGTKNAGKNLKNAFINGMDTEGAEFLDAFDVDGFSDLVQLALDTTTTDFETFKSEAKKKLELGQDEMDRLFGTREFEKIVVAALGSTETSVSDFKTNALLAIQAGETELDSKFGAQAFKDSVAGIMSGIPGVITTMKNGALTELGLFKTGAQKDLETGEGSVASSAGSAEDALLNIKTAVGDVDALAPSFATLKSALSGAEVSADDVDAALATISTEVDDIEGLAPSFATLRSALASDTSVSIARDAGLAALGVQGIGSAVEGLSGITLDTSVITGAINAIETEADGAKTSIEDMVPSDLELPEGYATFMDDFTPTQDHISRWYQASDALKKTSDNSYNVGRYMREINAAVSVLGFGDDTALGRMIGKVADLAVDIYTVVRGFEAFSDLVKMDFWGKLLGFLVDIGRAVWNWAFGQQAVNAASLAQGALSASGGAGAAGAGAAGGGSGDGSGGGSAMGLLATAMVFYESLSRLFGPSSPTPWEQAGITQEEWTQQQIDSGAYATFLGNLMGPGGALGLQNLLFGGGTSGLDFGGWGDFGNIGNWQGLGGGSGRMSQTINVVLDGQTIATATAPFMAGELEIRGTNF